MTSKKRIKLGADDPAAWKASLATLDAAMAGKKARYWRRVKYPKPMGKKEVKDLREGLHLSQLSFAQALGLSLSTIRSWEQGTKHPVGLARKVLRTAMQKPEILETLARA